MQTQKVDASSMNFLVINKGVPFKVTNDSSSLWSTSFFDLDASGDNRQDGDYTDGDCSATAFAVQSECVFLKVCNYDWLIKAPCAPSSNSSIPTTTQGRSRQEFTLSNNPRPSFASAFYNLRNPS
jgi:hypothetical protein